MCQSTLTCNRSFKTIKLKQVEQEHGFLIFQ